MDKKEQRKDYILRKTYGITFQEYNTLLKKQNGGCVCCGMKNKTLQKEFNKSLVVDHSHVTGKVRGLLCVYCNRALGMVTENPYSNVSPLQYVKNTLKYIEEHNMETEFLQIKEGTPQYKKQGTGLL